jgi:hypothetical protein
MSSKISLVLYLIALFVLMEMCCHVLGGTSPKHGGSDHGGSNKGAGSNRDSVNSGSGNGAKKTKKEKTDKRNSDDASFVQSLNSQNEGRWKVWDNPSKYRSNIIIEI